MPVKQAKQRLLKRHPGLTRRSFQHGVMRDWKLVDGGERRADRRDAATSAGFRQK